MKAENDSSEKGKWYSRLAIASSFLLALFWSLGPFFFWIFLGLTSFFGFRYFLSSGIRISAFNPQPKAGNPYRTYQTGPSSAVANPEVAKRIVRLVIIGVVALFLFFLVIGIIVGDPETDAGSATENFSSTDEGNESMNWNDLGNSALGHNNYDSAILCYDKALALDPDNQYALYNKGLVYSIMQDYKKSNRFARQCIDLHPEYSPALWLLGYNLSNTGKDDSALVCLERAYNNDFGEADFLELMAELYLKKNNREKATEFYNRVIGADSTKVTAYKKLVELDPNRADWYRRKINELETISR